MPSFSDDDQYTSAYPKNDETDQLDYFANEDADYPLDLGFDMRPATPDLTLTTSTISELDESKLESPLLTMDDAQDDKAPEDEEDEFDELDAFLNSAAVEIV